MKCPFELPVEAQVSVIDSDRRYITGTNGYPFICGDADKDYADYIVQAINSHEKLVKQKENLTLQLLAIDHYCRVNDIDIEEALKAVEKPND